jgi:hypothetical protein
MANTKLIKFSVCIDCFGIGIIDSECRCVTGNNFPTIQLEFEVCSCCENIIEDGNPADTEFNRKQFEKLKNGKN